MGMTVVHLFWRLETVVVSFLYIVLTAHGG